jgi:lipopolysaccharide biosynthesis glycosyltransferase
MLNIVYSANDAYVPYLGISILSLLDNNHNDFKCISIYILGNGISKESIEKLKIISNKYDNNHLIFVEVKTSELLSKTNSNLDLSTFNRLFLGSLIKDNIEKILYIDADTLILGSLKKIWNLNIDNYIVGGVQDLGGYHPINNPGLSVSAKYINAGVLLINFKEWVKIERKFISCLEKTKDLNRILHDQGIINAIVPDDEKLILKPNYNFMTYDMKYYKKRISFFKADVYYEKEIIKEAYENPIIIHGTPWLKDYPFKDIVKKYEYYVNISPFKYGEIFMGGENPFLHKVMNSLVINCPNFLHTLLMKTIIFLINQKNK